jgi:hypothetical protein
MNKEINVKKLFLLWEIMTELESLLWEIYFEEFMELCIEKYPDIMDGTANNDIPF